jgi:hypothetical protein
VPAVDRHVVRLLTHCCLIIHFCLAPLQDFLKFRKKNHWFWGFWPCEMWRRVLEKFVPDISKSVMLTPSKISQLNKDSFWYKTKTARYLETCQTSRSRTLPHIPPKLNPQQNFCGNLKHWMNCLIANLYFTLRNNQDNRILRHFSSYSYVSVVALGTRSKSRNVSYWINTSCWNIKLVGTVFQHTHKTETVITNQQRHAFVFVDVSLFVVVSVVGQTCCRVNVEKMFCVFRRSKRC